MDRRNWMRAVALVCLGTVVAHGQGKEAKKARQTINEVLTEFSEQNQGYQRELKYFEHVPAVRPLMDLHSKLLAQVVEMRKLETAGPGSGPAILKLAREMNHTAQQLDGGTTQLEKRAEAVSSRQDREVAKRMKNHSDHMVRILTGLITMFR